MDNELGTLDILPLEIIVHILNYLPLKDLLNCTLINKYLEYIIKNTKWEHQIILRNNIFGFMHIYNFINVEVYNCDVLDRCIKSIFFVSMLYSLFSIDIIFYIL